MKGQSLYNYHNNFIFRTPLLPIQKNKINVSELLIFSKQLFFLEAIYIASPELYYEVLKWHNNAIKEPKEIDKLVISLYKYYTRMQSRCTPFGLFASCGNGEWGNENKLILDSSQKRHTRLGMNYLHGLTQQLNMRKVIIPLLKYYSNNSLYSLGKTFRYIEYKYLNNRRVHQINSITHSDYLEIVLEQAKNGATRDKLISFLIDDEITKEDAKGFVDELIKKQLLVSELELSVLGDEYIYQIINCLRSINKSSDPEINSIIQLLEATQEQIASIDRTFVNSIESYQGVYQNLKMLKVPVVENQLFQTDLYKTTLSASLDKSIQIQLSEAIEFLNNFTLENEKQNLKRFKENFYNQYENSEIPLLEVLDTEAGIGYTGKDKSGINFLLDDIYFPKKEAISSEIYWNKQQQFLQDKLLEAIRNKSFTVLFTDDEIINIGKHTEQLPDSITVMFRLIDNKSKIFLQNCGGSSAANILSRFAHGDKKTREILDDIIRHEEKLNSDKILAEIAHISDSRLGNVLLRPVLRKYELAYLGKPCLAAEKQVQLTDLMVSVRENKIIIRSKKLNKEVFPRLSSAHNYSANALPVYQFLGDLQTQYCNKSGLQFNWGNLSNSCKFLPRAEYKNIILARAKWQLTKADFHTILDENKTDKLSIVTKWRQQLNVPKHVVLIEKSNELFIDLENELSIKMFISCIKKSSSIVLEEFLFDTSNLLIKDSKGNGYTNEFIVTLLKKSSQLTSPFKAVETLEKAEVDANIILQSSFNIGSEWLYYKLYSGVQTADEILFDVIKPLVDELLNKKLIDKFFFIRYSDPDTHIRLRFHINKTNLIGKVIEIVTQRIQIYVDQRLISKIQIDTYKRELERYGSNLIEITESFFFIDSIVSLNLIGLIKSAEGEKIRWQFAIRSINDLLDNFKLNAKEKMILLKDFRNEFLNENKKNKEFKLQLDSKFRSVRKHVEDILNIDVSNMLEAPSLIKLLEWKKLKLEPLIEKIMELNDSNQLEKSLNEILGNYMHMMINRIFKARQGHYEFVLYDILYRHLKSLTDRNRNNENVSEAYRANT